MADDSYGHPPSSRGLVLQFGESVATSGDTVIVNSSDIDAPVSGCVYTQASGV